MKNIETILHLKKYLHGKLDGAIYIIHFDLLNTMTINNSVYNIRLNTSEESFMSNLIVGHMLTDELET